MGYATKPSLWARIPSLKISSRLARMIIVLFLFANIGAYTVAVSNALTDYYVDFILFCSTDQCNGNVAKLNADAQYVRTWYGQQTGWTFRIGAVKVVRGNFPASHYGAGRASTVETYNRISFELASRGIVIWNTRAVVQLGFRSMGNCGVSSYRSQYAFSDPFKGCANIQDSVMAHELGHTVFGNGHLNDGSLMHAPLACNGNRLAACVISPNQKALVANDPWFNTRFVQTAGNGSY